MAIWPLDEIYAIVAPRKITPIEEINEKDTQGLLCLECGETPEQLISVDGLYYCQRCLDANERRDRWNEEEAEWSGEKKDDPPKD